MNFFFSLLIWLTGFGAPPSAQAVLFEGVDSKTEMLTQNPKSRHSDLTGGTSIIVIIDDTQYKPVFE